MMVNALIMPAPANAGLQTEQRVSALCHLRQRRPGLVDHYNEALR